MMIRNAKWLVVFLAAGCSSSAAPAGPAGPGSPAAAEDAGALPAAAAPDVAGRWKSACTPSTAPQAFTLDFTIADPAWSVDYAVYADAACAEKLLTVHIEGTYAIGAPSAVAGAYDARFAFTRKVVTPHVDAATQLLASPEGCARDGFVTGAPTDVSDAGCAGLGQRPVAACPADYDIVRVADGGLTFGLRPADNDMCTPDKRPKALAPVTSGRT